MTWARRLKRVFKIDINVCEHCRGALKIIACIERPEVIQRILRHLRHKRLLAPGRQPQMPRAPPATLVTTVIVELEGGTHNPMAPSFDLLRLCFAPLLARMGGQLELDFDCHGFYPNCGGRFVARIAPTTQWRALRLLTAPEPGTPDAHIAFAHMPESIAHREAKHLMRKAALRPANVHVREVASAGPGNIVSVRAQNDGFCNLFETYTARGVKAERVADSALRDYRRFCEDQVPVDAHLADQILLPMAPGAGGEFFDRRVNRTHNHQH